VIQILILIGAVVAVIAVSFVVEALRPRPQAPERLSWAPDIPVRYAEVNGLRLRYIQTGQGPSLVLLHTLRTQLDLFEKVIPDLANDFTVFALDYPGHGYSDIPTAKYDAPFFTDTIEGFLNTFDLREVTLAGVSIGASIALLIAARNNPRVSHVVAMNPYDYANGRGMARSSWLARVIFAAAVVPVLGETVMRLRNFLVMRNILNGGVTDPRLISPALLKEMYRVGNRRGHYRAFIALLRNAASWERAAQEYSRIRVPVLLIWGEKDWARDTERELDGRIIPRARMVTIKRAGHFLPLDRPDAVIELVRGAVRNVPN
jgi:pimeloyl-ACP methyl ester carboxylesterase